ncbi:MAG: penicillin-binding protein 2 [Chloroflexi bacterium]|nr:penicillin-binding protein 2 [Chloroflexota bacterium]
MGIVGLDGGDSQRWPGHHSLIFRVVVLLGFAIIIAQLWRLQIVEGAQFRERADNNRIRPTSIPAARGIVYDRQGRLVAANAPIFVVSAVPADLPRKREQEVIGLLAELLREPAEPLLGTYLKRREKGDALTSIPLQYNAPREAIMRIEEHHLDLPGVVVSVEPSRTYVQGPLLAHLVGYTGVLSPDVVGEAEFQRRIAMGYAHTDRVGVAGLEQSYEDFLRGEPGRRMVEVDVTGRVVNELHQEPPTAGHNLILTIDLELQRSVEAILRRGLTRSPVGAAVVMRPETGEVLALASLPSFDNNIFTAAGGREGELERLLTDQEQPLFNRALAGLYPPGSTFKLVTGAGALQEGLVQRDTIIDSKGAIYVPHDQDPNYRERFPDWAPLGKMNLIQGIANSSNVYFFYLGGGYEPEQFTGLGNERLAQYARLLGYGTPTGLDVPGEAAGVVPDEAWKLREKGQRWFKGDTYNMSIGQGFVQATLLQVANMTNVVANGGLLLKPRLVRAITDSRGEMVRRTEPELRWRVPVEPRHLALLAEGMEAGFHTGQLLTEFYTPRLRIAGKTGTAEYFGDRDEKGNLPTHGWFTGFAPADAPEISVTVFVQQGSGSHDATPIAMRILRNYFGLDDE